MYKVVVVVVIVVVEGVVIVFHARISLGGSDSCSGNASDRLGRKKEKAFGS